MEFAKQELLAVESTVKTNDEALIELSDLELAIAAGGTGVVSLG